MQCLQVRSAAVVNTYKTHFSELDSPLGTCVAMHTPQWCLLVLWCVFFEHRPPRRSPHIWHRRPIHTCLFAATAIYLQRSRPLVCLLCFRLHALRGSKQIQSVTGACSDMRETVQSLGTKVSQCDGLIKATNKKIGELESQKTAVDEKLTQHVRFLLCSGRY